ARLVRYKPHRNLCVGPGRQDGFRPLTCIPSPNSVHIQRWANPGALKRSKSFFAPNFFDLQIALVSVKTEGCPVKSLAFGGTQLRHLVVKPGNGNASFFIVKRSNHLTEHVDGIGYCAAIDSRVQIAVRTGNLNFHVTETPKSNRYRRMIQ